MTALYCFCVTSVTPIQKSFVISTSCCPSSSLRFFSSFGEPIVNLQARPPTSSCREVDVSRLATRLPLLTLVALAVVALTSRTSPADEDEVEIEVIEEDTKLPGP